MNCDIVLNGTRRRVSMQPTPDGGLAISVDGQACNADVQWLQPNFLSIILEGNSYRIFFDPHAEGSALVLDAQRISYEIEDPRSLSSRTKRNLGDTGARPVSAPMPGRIVRILVQSGDIVEAQQGLVVMEAMKMQNELKAPKAGCVTRLAIKLDATVHAGEVLLVIE